MFDPFKDFNEKGYLQNSVGLKDLSDVREAEYGQFLAQLPEALAYLAGLNEITFDDFLTTHGILFKAFYPTWAGKSRSIVLPGIQINKGSTLFCDPSEVRRAVEYGLEIAKGTEFRMNAGKAMGQFAFGHPFLDGNGRTMLLVHAELCYRAGFSIDWTRTNKTEYLQALTREIENPKEGPLDKYFAPFIAEKIEPERWLQVVTLIHGLDGNAEEPAEATPYDDNVRVKYKAFVERRGGEVPAMSADAEMVCKTCGVVPCVCEGTPNATSRTPTARPKST